ncbi:MAG: hypothetical protein QXU32_01265 [Nitrososphaerales archaeon]
MQKLDHDLEYLLDRFEAEVKPYDKLAALGLIVTPLAIVLIIVFGWLLAPSLPHDALRSFVATERVYWVIGGILAIVGATKLPILYAEHRKHQISNKKYKPLSGGKCMCDLSQLRYHMKRLDRSVHEGERIRHMRMINYYKQRLGIN